MSEDRKLLSADAPQIPPAPVAPGSPSDHGMTTANIGPGAGTLLRRVARRDLWALLALALVLALVMTATIRSPQKDDVAWLLYVARKWLAGQRLYEDLIEVNPPLIVWIYALPSKLSIWTGIRPKLVAIPFFAVCVLAAAWWTSGILERRASLFAHRIPLFALIGAVLLLLPGVEFGQREHLMAASVLPYLVVMACWMAGETVDRRSALAAGIVAGLGSALKPTYALAFVLPELLGWLRRRPVLRTAPIAAVVAALVYAGMILIFCPAFLHSAVPLALALYGGTDTPPLDLLDSAGIMLLGDVVLAVLWQLSYRRRTLAGADQLFVAALFAVLASFAVGATAVYLIEGKNWFYHRIPATVAIVLALLLWMCDRLPALLQAVRRKLPMTRPRRMIAGGAVLASLALGAIVQTGAVRMEPFIRQAVEPDLSAEVRLERLIKREGARTYLAFSEWIGLGFPVVNNTGVVWTSRFDSMWALRGEMWRARQDGRPPKDWPISHWVAVDFIKGCPDIAVVDARGGVNFVGVLIASDAAFAKAWTHYRQIAMFDGLRVLKRQGPSCSDQPGKPQIATAALPSP